MKTFFCDIAGSTSHSGQTARSETEWMGDARQWSVGFVA